jgi:hypothetical protein
MANIDYRKRLATLMAKTLADETARHDWDYEDVRPRPMPKRPWSGGMRIDGDCSKGVQFLCWWAYVPEDPMGMHYGPYGNSATIAAHLQDHLAYTSDLLVGDIVTFGLYGTEHAAMVMETGDDPLLWSFGVQGAPNTYRLSWDRRPHQLLRLQLPKYVPTKAEKLRAKTGYWAWLQWRLGEGGWVSYPPMAKTVRPHVPRTISPLWWRQYKKFLKNRQKGNKTTPTPTSEEAT